MPINDLRRYFLLKRLYAARNDEPTEAAWKAKQEAQSGTDLPLGFPHRAKLVGCGYSTIEDVDGSTTRELSRIGLSHSDAVEVIGALAAL